MGTKIATPTKRLALEKLRDGLSNKEIVDLTGVSLRTIQTWRQQSTRTTGLPARGPAQTSPIVPTPLHAEESHAEQERTTLDFEESPAPPEQKNIVDSALSSLKGMLGISEGDKPKKAPTPLSGKLDSKKQAFVDAAAPTVALALIAVAAWMWGHQGADYALLAPDEEVASRIVTPLLRVYARHASFLTDISPDMADVGASLLALVGYVHVSLGLYQQIKQQEQNYEYDQEQEGRDDAGRRRAYRVAKSESGARNAGRGYAAVSGNGGAGAAHNVRYDGGAGGVNRLNLSEKEAREHAALSRLSELDYQHRARRSGRAL
jgi:Homeodomain-like domain